MMTATQAKTKTAFTPSEWHAAGWSSNGTPVITKGDHHAFTVALVNSPEYGHGRRVKSAEASVAEGKANAALIAAAPAMYEACQRAFGELVYAAEKLPHSNAKEALAVVRAALKLAQGDAS